MSFLIEKLKISNFLSFLGEYEVTLKPFSAVMCNFYEGKDDFLRALEFVFGGNLSDLRVEKPLDLVHKILTEEFLVNRDIHTYVEVTLVTSEKKELKFCRSIKNGASSPRIEHKVSDLVTSSLLYEEKLNSLGVFIQKKNLIFHKSYFNDVIWGSTEDLEITINRCLREDYLLEDWRRANKEVERLTKLKNLAMEKNYNSMKKSHFVLANFTKKYELISANKENVAKEILRNFASNSFSESSLSLTDDTEEKEHTESSGEKLQKKQAVESKIDFLTESFNELKYKEAILTSCLYHEEIKVARKPVNASVLQNRISQIKSQLHEKELEKANIWENIQETKSKIDNLNRTISSALTSLREVYQISCSQNRFTIYGKFYDYLRPSRYVQLLKQIIGNEIFYAHLCDSVEEAFQILDEIKTLKYEHREVFIPFENYSHKLKDLIIASGEKGIQINNLEELLIFLCKLYKYHFIDEVPVIVQKSFNYENDFPDDFTIYIENNIHFTSDGLMSIKAEENGFYLESREEIKNNLDQLYIEEEKQYHQWKELLFMNWEISIHMNSLENDMFYLKRKWRKSSQKPNPERESLLPAEIYDAYSDIFKDYEENRKKLQSELQEEESFLPEGGDSSTSSNEEALTLITQDLENVVCEKIKTKKFLEELTEKAHQFDVVTIHAHSLQKNTVTIQKNIDQRRLFFEEKFKKLQKLMKEDDLEDFLGNQEWRKSFITSLIKDLEKIKAELKSATEKLRDIATMRKTRLYQLFDHCSRYLSSTFSHIIDDALPFIKLNFGFGEENVHLLSCLGSEKINIVDVKHFNTLLKFITTLSLFLEIANFDKIPVMVLDDVEEFFPIQNDDLEAALGVDSLEKILPERENLRFHLLMRLGQFLKHYIKKNVPGNHIRNNGRYKDYTNGPTQIIYFVKDDLIHAAEHCIWIHNQLTYPREAPIPEELTLLFLQILPEECLTENCNSYSEIHEIDFNDINLKIRT